MLSGRFRRRAALAAAMVLSAIVVAVPSAASPRRVAVTGVTGDPHPWDWRTYGHDPQHTFHGQTVLTQSLAPSLRQAWSFPTGDAVTATPTVVDGTVYVGSWDGYFYAIGLRTGQLRWKYQLSPQPAVTPYPGENPRDVTSVGGLVTSSAWFEPKHHGHPDLVIFAGGYTLYALDAHAGTLFWRHDYTGRPELPPDPVHDATRILSSPVVSGDKVLFGVDTNGAPGYRGYVVAASIDTGNPVWEFQTDVDGQGVVLNDGCGNVWSSGTLLSDLGLVAFSTADCQGSNTAPLTEAVVAFGIADGHVGWIFRPSRADGCDADFGATVNAGVGKNGRTTFVGVGGKDGTYYSLDPQTGQLRWSRNVVFGGQAGGFIGTTAFDGGRVYGSTALGDIGGPLCDPSNPRDTVFQEPTVHAFDAHTGAVLWEHKRAASFGPITVAADMTFNAVALNPVVQVRSTTTGIILAQLPVAVPCWCGIATVGDAIVFGIGTLVQGSPDAVVAFTPGGTPPVTPGAPQ